MGMYFAGMNNQKTYEVKKLLEDASYFEKHGPLNEALGIYDELWKKHSDNFNEWDIRSYASALRKSKRIEEAIRICKDLLEVKPDFHPCRNVYSWCIYDSEIKQDQSVLKKNEERFRKAANEIIKHTKQEKYSPYESTIFKVVDYLEKQRPHRLESINIWLDKLDPRLLSQECNTFPDAEGNERESPSRLEKWYVSKINALYSMLKQSMSDERKESVRKECIDTCDRALKEVKKFHNDQDIHILRKRALCKADDNWEKAVEELMDVLAKKPEWYIKNEIADIYYKHSKSDEAYEYALYAAVDPGEYDNKYKLFMFLGEILQKKQDSVNAEKHFILSYLICKEKGWKIPEKLSIFTKNLKEGGTDSINSNKLYKELREFWKQSIMNLSNRQTGQVLLLHNNDKSGMILGDDNKKYFFRKKSFFTDKNSGLDNIWEKGLRVSFTISKSFDRKRNRETDEAVYIFRISHV
jgi:tetratricopeptide (TPR) repeat protein